jgi:hypothetical protein
MGKESGLGDQLYIDGFDVSGDIGSIQTIGAPLTPLVMTDITQSAPERKAGLEDGALNFSSWFNPDSGRAFDALGPLPTTDRMASYFRGQAIGAPAASMFALQIGYDPNRDAAGNLALATALTASDGTGLEWGRQATAGKRTDTAATNGSSLDGLAASALGLVAYLHVFAFTGTSVTVKLQQSSDNGAGDAWADVVGGGFVAATGAGAQRIATATNLAVERYLRVVTTGTFSNAVFAVNVIRTKSLPSAS